MPMISPELVQQDEIRDRIKRLQDLFANDPEVTRIDHHLAQDWSGDNSIFIEVVLNSTAPPAAVVSRLSEQIGTALLRVVRSEELGLHAYLNFLSRPENGR